MDMTTDWFWEGNVVEALANHLSKEGWEIIKKANTQPFGAVQRGKRAPTEDGRHQV